MQAPMNLMSLSGIKGAIAAGALLALSAFNAYAAANFQPSGGAQSANPILSWINNDADPAGNPPSSYQVYLEQTDVQPYGAPWIITTTTLGCASLGQTCFLPLPSPLTQGQLVAWGVTPIYASGPWAGSYHWQPVVNGQVTDTTFYVADPPGSTWPLNTMAPTPCTQWYWVSDFPGQTRLIAFVSNGAGTRAGVGVLPETTQGGNPVFTTLDISDLVPLAAKEATVKVQTVFDGSCNTSGGSICDIVGWISRRTGSAQPTEGLWYKSANRGDGEYHVLLNNGQFDFAWGDVSWGGISPKMQSQTTGLSEEIAMRLVGYCQ
jgi:hypothetical protein